MFEIICILLVILFIFYVSFIFMYINENFEINQFSALQPQYYNNLSNVNNETQKLSLKMCIIKSSYNTALTNKNRIDTKNVKKLILQGCRFLDFEIFDNKDIAVVAVSKGKDSIDITSKNYIPLNDIFNTIMINAFSSPCRNYNDPLFIHLRIKSQNINIFHHIGAAVDKYFSNIMMMDEVNGDTLIKTLMNKVILIIDKSKSLDYTDDKIYPNCYSDKKSNDKCYNLSNYTTLESNSILLQSFTYKSIIKQVQTHVNSNVYKLKIILPDVDEKDNILFNEVTQNYGVQFLPMKFYNFDYKIQKYADFFIVNAIRPLKDVNI